LYSEAIELWDDGSARGLNVVDRTLEFFTELYLQDDILVKVDRAGMANSLETRSVFIDNDVVDFCARLPHYFKLRNGKRKYLLMKALEPLLPASVIGRRKKGFGIPLSSWLRQLPETIGSEPIPGMRANSIDHVWKAHRQGRADERFFLWCCLVLQFYRGRTAEFAPAGWSAEADAA
jgi:asparagine synthase (glutamine-hydrolysing)